MLIEPAAPRPRRRATLGAASWTYARPAPGPLAEVAWRDGGTRPGLARHFHDEVQVTLVVAGRRRFRVGAASLEAGPGACVVIPAGVPHTPEAVESPDGDSLNLYLPATRAPALLGASGAAIVRMPTTWLEEGRLTLAELLGLIDGIAGGLSRERARRAALVRQVAAADEAVAGVAVSVGMSREGFSRAFSREVGMAPHAYRRAARLNRARALLRAGSAPADAAAEAGFADQSHLGRLFRAAFGTTPAAYRRCWTG